MQINENDRIREVIKYIGKSINSIAKEIKVSQPTLKACVDGNNKPSFDTIQKLILAYPQINSTWLLAGKGEMLLTNEIKTTEIEIVNEIISNSRQIEYLYQRIVDVDILIKDYLKVPEINDFVKQAAEILNNLSRQYPQEWKNFDISGKRLHNEKLKEAVRLLQEMFFDRFKVLYKTMRGY
jgi:plasmid maintenance system antidote protein VapI